MSRKRGRGALSNATPEPNPRDYFEALRALAERYFSVWPAERDMLLAAHRREGLALSERLGVSLQEEADRLGDSPSDEELTGLADELERRWALLPPPIDKTPSSIYSPYRDRLVDDWLHFEKGRYGGRFAAALSSISLVPIFTPSEILAFSGSDEDLRDCPPVWLWSSWPAGTSDPPTSTPYELGALIKALTIRDRHGISREKMPGHVRELFDALIASFFENEQRNVPHTVRAEDKDLRATYRAFARAFYPWARAAAPAAGDAKTSETFGPAYGLAIFGDQNSVLTPPVIHAAEAAAQARALIALGGGSAELVATAYLDSAAQSGTRWKRIPNRPPQYGDDRASQLFTFGGSPDTALSIEQENRAWNAVLALDEDTLVTFVYVMFRWLAEGASDKVRISVDDLLALRDRKRHGRSYRPQQKREQRDHLLSLREQWITVPETITEQRGKTQRRKTVNVTSPLIELAIESEEDAAGLVPLPLGAGIPDTLPYVFRVSMGDWTKPYLGQGRRYVMPLVKTLAKYDPKQGIEQKALRIAIKLSFRWNSLADNGRTQQHWTYKDLLDEARVPVPTHNPLRFREQVEGALDRLSRDGVIGAWREDPENAPLPERGWLPGWLGWKIVIEPPVDLRAFYAIR